MGDLIAYQITALFANRAMLDGRRGDVAKFCRAYQRGVADYRAAFLNFDAQHRPILTPATDAAIADINRYVFIGDAGARAKILDGIGWYDEGAALDVADVKAQLAWFSAQGMVKGQINPDDIIDTRFLPQR